MGHLDSRHQTFNMKLLFAICFFALTAQSFDLKCKAKKDGKIVEQDCNALYKPEDLVDDDGKQFKIACIRDEREGNGEMGCVAITEEEDFCGDRLTTIDGKDFEG